MWWTVIFKALKNPTVLLGIGLVGVLAFYNLKVWSLEHTIEKKEIKIERLQNDLNISKGNYNSVFKTNTKNVAIIDRCVSDTEKLNSAYVDILDTKEIQITKLRKTIADMKKPVPYPKEAHYEDCTFKVLTTEDDNASASFHGLDVIGK